MTINLRKTDILNPIIEVENPIYILIFFLVQRKDIISIDRDSCNFFADEFQMGCEKYPGTLKYSHTIRVLCLLNASIATIGKNIN